MIEYLLGNFMINAGLMTNQDLERVMESQDKSRMKIGVLAVMKGYMTNEQTREVNFAQKIVNKKFGEIAVEKGYLTEQQVNELLERQGNEYLAFIQRLINFGLCSVEEADAILAGFQIENGFENYQMQYFKNADVEHIVEMYLPVGALEYKDLAVLAVETVIRFIDRHAYIGQAYMTDSYDAVAPVLQTLKGDHTISTGIADISGGMCTVATVFGNELFEELNEDVQDACGEFLNCTNGLYATEASHNDCIYELTPPELGENRVLCSDATLVIPIYMKDKCFAFLITDNMWHNK